ncbi:MAG: heme exporter protein CcmB [Anaerolineae bacterium]|jgi:heme exporter protein B
MGYLRKVWAIVSKDLSAELHTREMVSAMLVFAILALLVFSFALDLQGRTAQVAAPGVLWATVAFAGTLGLSRSLAREQHSGCMDGLLMAPVDRSAIFFGKALGNLIFIGIVELALLPLCTVLFGASLLRPAVLLVVALGTIGYAGAGTLLAAVAVNTRAREVLLPVLLLPLVVPALIAAVKATAWLVDGGSLVEVTGWVNLLVVYDLVMLAVSMLTFEYAVSE